MDKVVQTNAANAEESASASEELSAQAESMGSMVGDLQVLVEGSNEKDRHAGLAKTEYQSLSAPKVMSSTFNRSLRGAVA